MSIIKEYYENQIDMRGPGAEKARPAVTGTISILRYDDGQPLTLLRASALFNEAVKDFPRLDPKVTLAGDHIEIAAKPPAGYTRLPAHTIGARG